MIDSKDSVVADTDQHNTVDQVAVKPSHEATMVTDEAEAMDSEVPVAEDSESTKSKGMMSSNHKKIEEGASNIKQYWKKLSKPATNTNIASSPMKAPSSNQSATQPKKSPIRMVVKAVQKTMVAPAENDEPAHDLVIAESKSDLTDDDFDGPMSEFSEASAPTSSAPMSKAGSVRDLVSKIQNGNATAGGAAATGSALSKNLQAKKEARLARMAEIRGKVRCTAVPAGSYENIVSFSSFSSSTRANLL